MGGLWSVAPRLSGLSLFFVLALIGLPGLGNFVAEFLILVGTFRVNVVATVFASLGIVLAAVYGLWMVQRTFQGPVAPNLRLPDISLREGIVTAALVVVIVWLGLYPQPIIDTAGHGLNNVMKPAAVSYQPSSESYQSSVISHLSSITSPLQLPGRPAGEVAR